MDAIDRQLVNQRCLASVMIRYLLGSRAIFSDARSDALVQ